MEEEENEFLNPPPRPPAPTRPRMTLPPPPRRSPSPPAPPPATPIPIQGAQAAQAIPLSQSSQVAEVPWEERDFKLPASVWLSTLHKLVARHVRLPRSATSGVAGSQHPRFSMDNTPLELAKLKCEQAGLVYQGMKTRGVTTRTSWKGSGPMTAFNFCRTQQYKSLGVGMAALRAPGKGQTVSDVLTMAIPPITVTHVETLDEWRLEVDMYLGVFHSSKRFTLPVNANDLYTTDPTPLFVRMAVKVVKEMHARQFPLSRAFKRLLGPGHVSTDDEDELSSSSEEESGSEGEGSM